MTHLRLHGWQRVLHCCGGDPAERILDTLACLRARRQRVKATSDELRRVGSGEDPLVLQVSLVERNDGWDVAGRGARELTEVEQLFDRLASGSIGDEQH